MKTPTVKTRDYLVYAGKVVHPVVLEHVDDPRALHLHDGLHVPLDQLLLHHLHDPRLRALVQVVGGALRLLVDPDTGGDQSIDHQYCNLDPDKGIDQSIINIAILGQKSP